jgi:23S rRNA pseudouridine1911/1915/1917 synthase
VLARTSKAAARLTEQFKIGSVEKIYWAILEAPPQPASGELTHWVQKNDVAQRMQVVASLLPGAQQARLRYTTLGLESLGTLVEVRPLTGRKHQIRLQLATIGCPILGDRKYGAQRAFKNEAIALHCVRLAIDHPTTHERMQFTSPPPPAWKLRAR